MVKTILRVVLEPDTEKVVTLNWPEPLADDEREVGQRVTRIELHAMQPQKHRVAVVTRAGARPQDTVRKIIVPESRKRAHGADCVVWSNHHLEIVWPSPEQRQVVRIVVHHERVELEEPSEATEASEQGRSPEQARPPPERT